MDFIDEPKFGHTRNKLPIFLVPVIMFATLIIGIIAFSIGMFRRMRMTENEASTLPKWDASVKETSTELDSGSDENDLWNDSNASFGGKN